MQSSYQPMQMPYGNQNYPMAVSNLSAPVIMRCVEHMAHPGIMPQALAPHAVPPPPPPPLQPSTTPAQEPMQTPDLAIPPVIPASTTYSHRDRSHVDNRGRDNRDDPHARMSCAKQRGTASRSHGTPPPWLNNSPDENSSRSPSPLEKLMNREPPPDAHEAETALLQHYTRLTTGTTAAQLAEADRRPPKGSVGRQVEEQLRSRSPPRRPTTRKKPVRTKSRQATAQQPMQLKAKARPQRKAAPHGLSLAGGYRPTPYVSVRELVGPLHWVSLFRPAPPTPNTNRHLSVWGFPYLPRVGIGGGRSRWQAGRDTHPIRPPSSLRPRRVDAAWGVRGRWACGRPSGSRVGAQGLGGKPVGGRASDVRGDGGEAHDVLAGRLRRARGGLRTGGTEGTGGRQACTGIARGGVTGQWASSRLCSVGSCGRWRT